MQLRPRPYSALRVGAAPALLAERGRRDREAGALAAYARCESSGGSPKAAYTSLRLGALGKSLSSDRARSASQKQQKEASRRAAPDARECLGRRSGSALSFSTVHWRCWLDKADNDRQGDDADEQPKQNSLQERPPANGSERLRREPCPDQKQRECQTGCRHVPQCGGYAGHPRHETASHRGEQEKANKPRHLHLGLKLRCGLAVSLARSGRWPLRPSPLG